MSQEDGPTVLAQVLSEVASGNFPMTGEVADLIRQAGLVNLWFFLRFIAGYRGPYQDLGTTIHLEMANFYQLSLRGGSKIGICMPRGSFKSTIATHGGATWRLVRNPNTRCGILVANADRGDEFYNNAKRNFEDNEFISALYPYTKPDGSTVWNSESFTLPGRTRSFVEPSLKYISIDSSTAGNHFDVLCGDDIVGEAQLTSDRSTSADMDRAKGKFRSAIRTIIDSPRRSSVTLAFTRYASNDAYDWIFDDISDSFGASDFVETRKANGEWLLYGRSVMENGESIYPERWGNTWLEKMREDDPWTFWTQYMNNPSLGGMGDLSIYRVRSASVLWDEPTKKYWVDFKDDKGPVSLRTMRLIAAVDPAASERRGSVKTSKQALVVLAMDKEERIVVLDLWTKHAPSTELFEKCFSAYRTWRFSSMFFEMQGPFEVLRSHLNKAREERGSSMPYTAIKALGDKLDTARQILQPLLQKEKLFVSDRILLPVEHAIRNFPTGNMDLIDALKIGCYKLRAPDEDFDYDEDEREERAPYRMLAGVDPLTGM